MVCILALDSSVCALCLKSAADNLRLSSLQTIAGHPEFQYIFNASGDTSASRSSRRSEMASDS